MAHARGERLPEEVKGTHHTKALPIDDIAQKRILEDRARKRVSWAGGERAEGALLAQLDKCLTRKLCQDETL